MFLFSLKLLLHGNPHMLGLAFLRDLEFLIGLISPVPAEALEIDMLGLVLLSLFHLLGTRLPILFRMFGLPFLLLSLFLLPGPMWLYLSHMFSLNLTCLNLLPGRICSVCRCPKTLIGIYLWKPVHIAIWLELQGYQKIG